MKSYKIEGGAGAQLHVVETGNPSGHPILFIHGLSQCCLTWSRQLNSDLAEHCRLVAMDLRGHGLSDKPREGYADSQLWADDVRAVIQGLGLDHPVLCGWSYGPIVILDYFRHYGEDEISGVNFIGGVTKLGSDEAIALLTHDFLSLVPGFFSNEVEQSAGSIQGLLRLCFARELAAEDLYLMLGFGVSVPPYVRQALLTRSVNNDDLLPQLHKPVLITHGSEDAVVRPAAVDQHKAGMPHAEVDTPKAGHAPFWDDAAGFNRRLLEFVTAARLRYSSM